MIFIAGERIGKGRAVSRAVVDIFTSFAEFEAVQRYELSGSEAVEFRVVAPHRLQVILIDSAQFDMAELNAGHHDAV